MFNDLPLQYRHDELELDAYNAAFYELGLRWHWDAHTYDALMRHSACPKERLMHYLKTQQPHLLQAYEPDFLAGLIEARHQQQRRVGVAPRRFDWAAARAGEIGV